MGWTEYRAHTKPQNQKKTQIHKTNQTHTCTPKRQILGKHNLRISSSPHFYSDITVLTKIVTVLLKIVYFNMSPKKKYLQEIK